jgi:hypothetical protein
LGNVTDGSGGGVGKPRGSDGSCGTGGSDGSCGSPGSTGLGNVTDGSEGKLQLLI